jgi:hypothetical protein
MVLLPKELQALKKLATQVGLDLRGASLNLDGGVDSKRGLDHGVGHVVSMTAPGKP